MQRGSAYMTMWMEVVRQLNMAVGSCNSDQFQTAGEAIDAAAVLYTGSLTVVDGGKDAGVFQYGLVELHADLAKPVNHTSVDQNTSDAKLNIQVLKEFKAIQKAVSRNSKQCTEAEASRKKIINYMKIPLVQGVIYYAYQREKEIPMTDDARENMKYEELQSKGATFAAALLPWIHACNVEAAEAVHNNMQMGAPTYFQVVLDALTQNYECLGVDCVDIGGVWSGRDGDYKEGAFPCGVTAKERTNNGSAGFSIRGIASLVVTVAAAAFLSL
jgi:hypothetical protein